MKKNVFIHIGKFGGKSARTAVEQSGIPFDRIVHLAKPPVAARFSYVICCRAPISRALSAFNWRYRLVVEDAKQPTRFPGEREILEHYQTLNKLAESLYNKNDVERPMAHGQFRSIHHLAEGISYYLQPLLDSIAIEQIIGVCAQESLANDLKRVLGVEPPSELVNLNPPKNADQAQLSDRAKRNLVRFLQTDYDCLEKLRQWKLLSPEICAKIDMERNFS